MQSCIIFGRFFQRGNAFFDIICQSRLISDNPDAHIIPGSCLQTGLHIITQKLHKCIYFILRSVPVLCGERIYSQILNAHIVSCFTDRFYILRTLYMSCLTWQSFGFCPSAITIQNDCYMFRYTHLKLPPLSILYTLKRGHNIPHVCPSL